MDIKDILDIYYTDITNQISEKELADFLPQGYEGYEILGIYQANDDVYDVLASDGYSEVIYVRPALNEYFEDFLGMVIHDRLYDVTSDIEKILYEYEFGNEEEDEEDWSEETMLQYGKQLYNSYGPDIDTYDMPEYDAECYLAYKRSIGL